MGVRAMVLTPINTKHRFSAGEGGTLVEQENELKAKLGLVVGNTLTVSESASLAKADYATGFSKTSGQDYAIGVINMTRAGAGEEPPIVHATVEIPYMATFWLVANTNLINTDAVTAVPVAGFITAYRDGQGIGGYTADLVAPSFYKLGKKKLS